ncbi:MAG: glycosyltransferase family 4 protein [Dysgonamonadaceae bacterium]|jgi:glycosyltransferase involved in cell wall biosynthesis|nr:glycosyltransferase family 4 protein [Dysgonamonadaceae bacterium]
MKILFDNQIFSIQNFGGISRYFYELIRNLAENIDYDLPIAFSNNYYLRDKDISFYKTFSPHLKFTGRTTIIKFLNYRLQKKYFYSDYDIFHPTYYDPYFLNFIEKKPFVFTIHDLTHEIFSLQTKKDDWAVRGKRILSEKADQIIAVSENTKKDIVNRLHIHPDRIKVIYHGCSLKPVQEKKMTLPDRYILFVGERGGYKNFQNLANAFSLLLQSDKELKLIVTGKPFFRDEHYLLRSLKINKNTIHYTAGNEELAELYSSALAFVYPSIYEGFGIPILEAFTCGCPVILSNSSCFPEIAENAGEYFDSLNIDSMVDSIKKVIYNHTRQEELIRQGKERSAFFSWEKTANQTLQLYKSI